MSIEHADFIRIWRHICRRFNRDFDHEQAAAYFDYLGEYLTTEEFTASARHIWATSRFFPRPADFLVADATDAWRQVSRTADLYTTPAPREFGEAMKALPPRCKSAVRDMGGIDAVKREMAHSTVRAREAFERAYEAAVVADMPALPGGGFRDQLKAAG
jgi:hypothetical protein